VFRPVVSCSFCICPLLDDTGIELFALNALNESSRFGLLMKIDVKIRSHIPRPFSDGQSPIDAL